jgi:hypothetical protein
MKRFVGQIQMSVGEEIQRAATVRERSTPLRSLVLGVALAWLAMVCASCTSLQALREVAPSQASAQWYMAQMYQRIALSRTQMPVLEMAGQAAAHRVVDGGYIWAGGSQTDFGPEAVNRTGGLAAMRQLDVSQVFRRDVVLYGARGSLSGEDLKTIARCKDAGAYVIAFAAADGSARTPEGPDLLIDSGSFDGLPTGHGICPLDTVANLINLWIFTGEFTSSCTRLGKMPVMYASHGIAGGAERDAKYAGQIFHDDKTIAPIEAGVLGNAYLDRITKILSKVEHDDLDDIMQAGRWVGAAGPENCGAQVIASIYPNHFLDSRAARPFKSLAGPDDPPPRTPILIHISYQRPPQELIDAARREHTRMFSCSVLRGKGGISEYSLYANPHWPIEDSCVGVPGYDVPILPSSGVMQATIYWSIVAEAYRAR